MKKTAGILIGVIVLLLWCNVAFALSEGGYEYKIQNNEATIISISNELTGEIVIPEELGGCKVTRIGGYDLPYNDTITKVTLPSTLKEIDTYGFYSYVNLEEVVFNEGLEKIGHYAFSNTKLKAVNIPEAVTYIGMFAFSSTVAEEIYLGKNVSDIQPGALTYCENLKSITVSPENQTYSSFGGVLYTKDKKTLVQYPSGREGSFYIPTGVEKIFWSAFESSKVTEVVFSDTVTYVGELAFVGCNSLERIYINKNLKTWYMGGLDYCENISAIFYEGTQEDLKNINISNSSFHRKIKTQYEVKKECPAKIQFDENGAKLLVENAQNEIVCALYKEDSLVGAVRKQGSGTTEEFEISEHDFDRIKVFEFTALENLTPNGEAINL